MAYENIECRNLRTIFNWFSPPNWKNSKPNPRIYNVHNTQKRTPSVRMVFFFGEIGLAGFEPFNAIARRAIACPWLDRDNTIISVRRTEMYQIWAVLCCFGKHIHNVYNKQMIRSRSNKRMDFLLFVYYFCILSKILLTKLFTRDGAVNNRVRSRRGWLGVQMKSRVFQRLLMLSWSFVVFPEITWHTECWTVLTACCLFCPIPICLRSFTGPCSYPASEKIHLFLKKNLQGRL